MGISQGLAPTNSIKNVSSACSQIVSARTSLSKLPALSLLLSAYLISIPAVSAQELASTALQADFSVSQLAPDTFPVLPDQAFGDDDAEPSFNPYRLSELEPAIDTGIRFQESGQHTIAIKAFGQALQITRIRYGLYHEAQIPLLEGIIVSGMEMSDWELVDERYAYMEHLFRRLYETDDPRLEEGLQKISSFHVNAFNTNLDGRREYHLRRAANLFRSRLEVAELTLAAGNPLFAYLSEGIEISRQHLYRMSSAKREQFLQKQSDTRENLLAELD